MTDIRRFARAAMAVAFAASAAATAPAFASHSAGSHDTTNTHKLEVRNDGKGHVLYCALVPAMTGSILNTKVCKTLAQWKAAGVEIPATAATHSGAGA